MKPVTPVLYEERSVILDVLRGLALLGIIIANTGGFSVFTFLEPAGQKALFTHHTDPWIGYVLTAFVEGKFYSLFSLLFGIGFTIILERNKKAGRNSLVVFYRRVSILMLIGLAHCLLLWDGDILLLYGIIGMVLPLFSKLRDKTLLVIAVVLIFSPLIFDLVKVMTQGRYNLSKPFEKLAIAIDTRNGITPENWRTWLVKHNTYESILKWCQGSFFWRYQFIIDSNRVPKVLAMFLLGLIAGRRMIYARLEENKWLLKKILKWGLIIGVPASIAFSYFQHDPRHLPEAAGLLDTLFYALSVIPLSLGYTALICLLWLKPRWHTRLKTLAPAGRMALTNYLMQTILSISIYYGVGLGLGAKFGPTIYIPIAVAIYTLQVWYSTMWLKYFQYGPFEWIWRQLTYWKKLPLRKPPIEFR
ncbi:MAG: DUF418 domain-containing protein [Bacteroidota bacterium]